MLGISIFCVLYLIHFWTSMHPVPSPVAILGSPQLSWVLYMGVLPLVPYLHPFPVVSFIVHSFLPLLIFPDTLWSTPLSIQLLCYYFVFRPRLHNIPFDTTGPVLGPKTITIVCVVPFSTLIGFRKVILMSLRWLQVRISKLLYDCCMVLPSFICSFCVMHPPPPDIFLLAIS